jgi:hypothetical protein
VSKRRIGRATTTALGGVRGDKRLLWLSILAASRPGVSLTRVDTSPGHTPEMILSNERDISPAHKMGRVHVGGYEARRS